MERDIWRGRLRGRGRSICFESKMYFGRDTEWIGRMWEIWRERERIREREKEIINVNLVTSMLRYLQKINMESILRLE